MSSLWVLEISSNIPTDVSFSSNTETREMCPNTEVFLVSIFPHSDWMRRDTDPANIYLFKVNNRNTFTPFSSVSIVDFEQVNVRWWVSLRVQSECWKIRTRNNSLFWQFSRIESFCKFLWCSFQRVVLFLQVSIYLFEINECQNNAWNAVKVINKDIKAT